MERGNVFPLAISINNKQHGFFSLFPSVLLPSSIAKPPLPNDLWVFMWTIVQVDLFLLQIALYRL